MVQLRTSHGWLLGVVCVLACSKKPEAHEDPAAKPAPSPSAIASASASASEIASASPDAAPSASSSAMTASTKKRPIRMREVGVDIVGRLPPEVIKRIVRASFPRFRACYEQGLKSDPGLKGIISVRITIAHDGSVESATLMPATTMTDKKVTECVLGVDRALSFPESEGGKVIVTYPIDFDTNDDDPLPSGGKGVLPEGPTYGCPCGCDHSEDMIAELRGLERKDALREIDDSLRTIGEREDAGYITERMVKHRLRLAAFGGELGRVGPVRFTPIPKVRPMATGTFASVRVGAQFAFHGETTEWIKGKEKLLNAAFVLRLGLENTGDGDVSLQVPTLRGDVALPVSRWYVVGGDGAPWDGVLRAKERVVVHVIGYAGEAVLPGAEVAATVDFASLHLPVKTRARKHWNDAD